ncbi:unnamed protein product [Thelazia callipaeda]|uniref:Gamma-aminobutyric acid receptor subunit beta n=1 Tax=Thelazia callipaeda TaxID=103827 RepID=A0A0N5CLY6_THECL|nr:unnamed protein product [Thelazia callipaeda]
MISTILDKLVDNYTYDRRLRPKYGAEPVNVGITMHLSSISAVSEVDMDFTLDFYLRQTWNDPRLAFSQHPFNVFEENDIESLTVGIDYLQKLWKPDTFFPNEKKSFFHIATTHNSFLRIDPNGNVLINGYSVLDIIYFFNKSKDSITKSEFELPQFILADVQFVSRNVVLSSGNYSRLICVFLFERNIGFYIIQIYLPSILIVVTSWVSFWLNRDATPARVALGVFTVLTMTTLTTTTNAAMPKVSYVKSIDIFLGVSFVMVFSSLLEYAAVGYISKRIKLIQKKQKDLKKQDDTIIPLYQPFYSSRDKNSNLYNGGQIIPPGECQCPIPPPSPKRKVLAVEIPEEEEYLMLFCIIRPSKIDEYSRSIFPLIFIVFNMIYWSYYYNISGPELADVDLM